MGFGGGQPRGSAAGVGVVSDVQAYLDLYARGGRDLKQAEVLLNSSIQRRWSAA